MGFSLAPFRYWNVFADQQGPIDEVWVSDFPILGKKSFQASARLRPDLTETKMNCAVFGNHDGTGTNDNPAIAQHMAISEALERWALLSVQRSGEGKNYGFDIDPSSNGMAAFPGFAWQARQKSRLEALERFALTGWWNGNFAATRSELTHNISLVRIHHRMGYGEVAITYRKSPNGLVSYGHAAAASLKQATTKAIVEMVRSEFVLSRYQAASNLTEITNFFERRTLHFASPEGHAEFLRKVTSKAQKPTPRWKTIFDGEIKGPWSKWTTIWRHAVEMPSYDFLNRNALCFFW